LSSISRAELLCPISSKSSVASLPVVFSMMSYPARERCAFVRCSSSVTGLELSKEGYRVQAARCSGNQRHRTAWVLVQKLCDVVNLPVVEQEAVCLCGVLLQL